MEVVIMHSHNKFKISLFALPLIFIILCALPCRAQKDDYYQKLVSAASTGDVPAVKDLLSKTSLAARQEALIVAARQGKIEVVRILLKVLDDSSRPAANSALIFATEMAGRQEAWVKIVEILLNWGADPNEARIVNDITPLMMTVDHGNIRLVRLFLENCADVSAKDADGHTALDRAEKGSYTKDPSEKKKYHKIKELLKEGACASQIRIPTDVPEDIREEIDRLHSSNSTERISAIDNLRKMGSKAAPAVPFLVEILGDRSEIGRAASDALTEIGSPAVESLLKALNNKRSCVRSNAVGALRKISDPRVEDALIKALKDKNAKVRWGASSYFSEKATARAILFLIEALRDEYSMVRENTISALGKLKDPRAIKPLIALLKEDDSIDILDQAVQALLQTKATDPDTIEVLIRALKEKRSWVRRGVMAALSNINEPRIVDPLIEALRDADFVVRDQAARKLGNMKDPRAIGPLIRALEEAYERDRHVIAAALAAITGEDFGEDPVQWRSWWKQQK
jgi:HEAT repeat protein